MRKIIIHRSEPDKATPYGVECPSLGIASLGERIADAIQMIHEAIERHIEDLIAHGESVPLEDAAILYYEREQTANFPPP